MNEENNNRGRTFIGGRNSGLAEAQHQAFIGFIRSQTCRNLITLRKRAFLTESQVAGLLRMPKHRYIQWETEQVEVPSWALLRLSAIYEVSLEDFLTKEFGRKK